MRMQVVASNRFDELYAALCEELMERGDPLKKRVIVFASKAAKEEVMQKLANEHGIAAGPRFLELGSAVSFLAPHLTIPSSNTLALHIESLLDDIEEVRGYIEGGSSKEKRKQHLSRSLGSAILQSEQCGGLFSGWQKNLRNALFEKWDTPHNLCSVKGECEVFLFALPYLSPLLIDFFSRFKTTLYHLSPCQEFWGDALSDHERAKAVKESSSPYELDGYLRTAHRLLANFGKVGREQYATIEDFPCHDRYVLPEGSSMLAKLQEEMLTLAPQEKIEDGSIQVHSAPTKMREVEVMHSVIMDLFAKDPSLTPSDIVVYAPDICEYSSYIELLFAKDIGVNISGISRSSQNEYLQALLHLFSFNESRFEVVGIIKLLSYEPVRARYGIKESDVLTIEKWAKEGAVKWGYDSAHRDALLKQPMLERTDVGSWAHLLQRLAISLATNRGISIDFSCASLVGSLFELLTNLHKMQKQLLEDRPIAKWQELLRENAEQFLSTFQDSEKMGKEIFLSAIESLSPLGKRVEEYCYSFSSVWWLLEKECTKNVGKKGPALNSIRAQSLKNGNGLAAKVIYVLGLDEESFPKNDVELSITSWQGGSFSPKRIDTERYLFLELLLLAEERFICSYEAKNERNCAVPVQELHVPPKVHPPFPFHKSYFSEGGLRSYSEKAYNQAKAYYGSEKVSKKISPLFDKEVTQVSIRQLAKLARNPMQFYLNESLGIYLEQREEDRGEFVMSALSRYLIKNEACFGECERAIQKAKEEGKLPFGPFSSLAEKQLVQENRELSRQLSLLGIKEVGSIEGIEYQVGDTLISGDLENVTPEGLLFFSEGKLADLLAVWPTALLYAIHKPDGKLIFAKKGKRLSLRGIDPHAHLSLYLDYYKKALLSPSPLVPSWAEALLKGDENEFVKVTKASISPQRPFIDRHLMWGLKHFESKALFGAWVEPIKPIIEPLLLWRENAEI